MKIKDFILTQWQLYPFQIIGAILLLPAFVISVFAARTESIKLAYIAWSILTVVGALDIYIIRQARKIHIKVITITRWVRNLLPKKADIIIMFGFISLVWWLTGPLYALFYMHGFLNDHFNENR